MSVAIGKNTPEEMAAPPADRPVKVGTEVHTTATELLLWIDEFVEERYLEAFAKTAESSGVCHADLLDTMELARDFVCDKIREKWQREWDKAQSSRTGVKGKRGCEMSKTKTEYAVFVRHGRKERRLESFENKKQAERSYKVFKQNVDAPCSVTLKEREVSAWRRVK